MKLAFDLAALIARVTIGVIFVAHGWQKWQNGLGPTSQMFTQSGVPQPELAAGFTTMAELVGGSFLIIGLLTRLAALALLCVSLGAIIFVHGKNGIFVTDMGWELVGALGAACLLLLAAGAGRISVDGIVRTFLRKRAADQTLPESTGSATTTTTMPTNVRTVREVPRTDTDPPSNGTQSPPTEAPSNGTEPRADVPRQSTPPPATSSGAALSDDDMKALDALMSDDQPRKNPPE
ncbi:DoxX family protein [Nonomuraea endophytica]|uniref:Putative oxidoreductase n=1 Tax=Nonomuraea endophytica TaxID=714136 RepID=A0A7W8ACZ7_9ACTN|nr:DoxX family protein [Nonomuraea endophytica]MBB5082836.1 putative oxidoreductase [Nonomuraea endophytica]